MSSKRIKQGLRTQLRGGGVEGYTSLRSWTQSPVWNRMSSHNTCELSINLSKTDFFVLFLKLFCKSEII